MPWLSATVLTYNIVGQNQKDPDYLLYLVDELSESKFPHDIPDTYEFAQIQVVKLAEIMSKVRKVDENFKKSCVIWKFLIQVQVVLLILCLVFQEKMLALPIKERVDKGIYAVSVRGSPSCKTHLGKLVSSVAG